MVMECVLMELVCVIMVGQVQHVMFHYVLMNAHIMVHVLRKVVNVK